LRVYRGEFAKTKPSRWPAGSAVNLAQRFCDQ
jgi:hypothetical protein